MTYAQREWRRLPEVLSNAAADVTAADEERSKMGQQTGRTTRFGTGAIDRPITPRDKRFVTPASVSFDTPAGRRAQGMKSHLGWPNRGKRRDRPRG
jgi:hypothetical protein